MFNLFIKPAFAQAQNIADIFPPAKSFPTLGALINVIIPNIFTITGIIALFFIVIAGVNVIAHAGQGESEKAGKDKEALTAAIIGLVIIVMAYFIVQVISTVLGYNILSPPLPN